MSWIAPRNGGYQPGHTPSPTTAVIGRDWHLGPRVGPHRSLRQRAATALIRWARRLDPNSVMQWTDLKPGGYTYNIEVGSGADQQLDSRAANTANKASE